MSIIPQDILDEITNRVDLVSFISEHVPLKKAGKDYKGLCPFHQEKSPSFMVSPSKRIFHCFGCGQGGNLFGFLMKIENLPFPEAVSRLAAKAGVDLPKDGGEPTEKKDVYYKINRYAAWFFADCLKQKEGSIARDYLRKRGINAEMIEEFKIGYAPNSWEALTQFLNEKGVPMDKALALGLIRQRKEGGTYDFFRNRLIFPIMDYETRVIGFGGRRLVDQNSVEAKYINSPESPVYQKGSSIYGLAQAKKALRDTGTVVLVEGYLDLIALFQAGIQNVAAPLGTALTTGQVNILKRFVEKFVVMFDGDDAGRGAMLKSLNLLFAAGCHPHVVTLPQGEDPDTAVKKKGTAWMKKTVDEAPLAMEWMILEELGHTGGQTSKKVEAVKGLMPFIQALPSELERQSYTARVTQFLGLGENALEIRGNKSGGGPFKEGPMVAKISLERILLGLYVRYPQLGEKLITAGTFELFEDERLKRLGCQLQESFKKTGDFAFDTLLGPENEFDENLSELAFGAEEVAEAEQMMGDCMARFRRQKLQDELKNLTGEIHLAEIKNDTAGLQKLISQKNEAVKNLKTL